MPPKKKKVSTKKAGRVVQKPVRKAAKKAIGTKKSAKKIVKKQLTAKVRQPTGSFTPAKVAAQPDELEAAYDHLPLPEQPSHEKYLTVGDHLEELRKRILWVFGTLVAVAIGVGVFSHDLHDYLRQPYFEITGRDMFLNSVYGPLESMVKLSIMTSFTISLPVSFYILWGFVTPALERKTAFMGHFVIGVSCVLFWVGVTLCWEFIFPLSLNYMFTEFIPPGVEPQITIEKYYSFLFMLLVAAGLTFQMPLLLVVLGAMGVLSVAWHKRTWKYVMVGIFVFSAFVTPPDPVSQLLFALPLLLLYCVSVFIVYLIERRRLR